MGALIVAILIFIGIVPLRACKDTYLIWNLYNAPTAGLTASEIEALAADVPAILESVELTPLD